MSYSKYILLGIAFLILGFLVVLKMSNKGVDKEVDEVISILKSDNTSESDCKLFERLNQLSSQSKKATLAVAEMYVRGICVNFSLADALKWYQKANLSGKELGHALLMAALWEVKGVNGDTPTQDELLELFYKVKELGYGPTDEELKRLPPIYAAVFL